MIRRGPPTTKEFLLWLAIGAGGMVGMGVVLGWLLAQVFALRGLSR